MVLCGVCILFDKPVGDAAATQTEYFSLFISEFVKNQNFTDV